MYAMVRELTRLKLFKFKIITTSIGYKDIGDPELLKLDIEYLDDKSIKFPIKLILRSIQMLSKYDIIHLNSLYDWPSIILFLFAKIFKKKIIWSVRGELYKEAVANSYKKKIFLKLVSSISKEVTFHLTSKLEISNQKSFFNDKKLKIVPNLILNNGNVNYRKKKQIIFLGRFVKHKNIKDLIIAFKNSKLEKHGYKLILCGEKQGSYFSELKKIANPNIIFAGYVSGKDKWRLVENSEVLFLPSKSENFGNVVLEALSVGTLVVVTKNSPWISYANNSFLFTTDNSIDDLIIKLNNTYLINHEEKTKRYMMAHKFYKQYVQNNIKLIRTIYD